MTERDLQSEALSLPVRARAELADALLASLDDLSEEEVEALWAAEAARRDEELTRDPSRGIPADEVFRTVRARLR